MKATLKKGNRNEPQNVSLEKKKNVFQRAKMLSFKTKQGGRDIKANKFNITNKFSFKVEIGLAWSQTAFNGLIFFQ